MQRAFVDAHQAQGPTLAGRVTDINKRHHNEVPVLAVNGALDADDHLRFARDLLTLVPQDGEVLVADSAHYPELEGSEP